MEKLNTTKNRCEKRTRKTGTYLVLASSIALSLYFLFSASNWLIPALTIVSTVLLVFYIEFEETYSGARVIALLGVLTSLTTVSRQILHSVSEFSPVFFLVIATGYVYGSLSGFAVGATTILLSNFFLGHGPWTPFQMMGLGLTGFFSAFIPKTRSSRMNLILLTVYGVISAYFYGLFTDVFWWIAFASQHNLQTYVAVASAGILQDTSRALGNIIFILILGPPVLKILQRFRKRFHINIAAD